MLIESFQGKSSVMLLDPSYAVAGCLDALSPQKGLFVSVEDPYSPKTEDGATLTSLVSDWSVAKTKCVGGDAIKLLIWYRPDGDAQVNAHQQELVRQVGEECRKYDIPLFLELLSYPPIAGQNGSDDLAQTVLKSVEEFAKPEYQVDVFLLESPVAASELDGNDANVKAEALELFQKMDALAGRPWVMLSMGADMDQFHTIMELAYEAGSSGYLAGRAYWLNTLSEFPNWEKMRADVSGYAQDALDALNALSDRCARPWTSFPDMTDEGNAELKLGADFCRAYKFES